MDISVSSLLEKQSSVDNLKNTENQSVASSNEIRTEEIYAVEVTQIQSEENEDVNSVKVELKNDTNDESETLCEIKNNETIMQSSEEGSAKEKKVKIREESDDKDEGIISIIEIQDIVEAVSGVSENVKDCSKIIEVKEEEEENDDDCDGVVLVTFRQLNNTEFAEKMYEIENVLSVSKLETACDVELVSNPEKGEQHRSKPRRRNRKKGRGKKACKSTSDVIEIEKTDQPPAIVSPLQENTVHNVEYSLVPRERLSSFSSPSSSGESEEEGDKPCITRAYYFTDLPAGELTDNDVTDDLIETVTSAEVQVKDKEDFTPPNLDIDIPAPADDGMELCLTNEGTSCSSDSDDPDGHHFSTVFVVNTCSSSDEGVGDGDSGEENNDKEEEEEEEEEEESSVVLLKQVRTLTEDGEPEINKTEVKYEEDNFPELMLSESYNLYDSEEEEEEEEEEGFEDGDGVILLSHRSTSDMDFETVSISESEAVTRDAEITINTRVTGESESSKVEPPLLAEPVRPVAEEGTVLPLTATVAEVIPTNREENKTRPVSQLVNEDSDFKQVNNDVTMQANEVKEIMNIVSTQVKENVDIAAVNLANVLPGNVTKEENRFTSETKTKEEDRSIVSVTPPPVVDNSETVASEDNRETVTSEDKQSQLDNSSKHICSSENNTANTKVGISEVTENSEKISATIQDDKTGDEINILQVCCKATIEYEEKTAVMNLCTEGEDADVSSVEKEKDNTVQCNEETNVIISSEEKTYNEISAAFLIASPPTVTGTTVPDVSTVTMETRPIDLQALQTAATAAAAIITSSDTTTNVGDTAQAVLSEQEHTEISDKECKKNVNSAACEEEEKEKFSEFITESDRNVVKSDTCANESVLDNDSVKEELKIKEPVVCIDKEKGAGHEGGKVSSEDVANRKDVLVAEEEHTSAAPLEVADGAAAEAQEARDGDSEMQIRSGGDPVMLTGETATLPEAGGSASVAAGESSEGVQLVSAVVSEQTRVTNGCDSGAGGLSPSEPRYTSLIMITQQESSGGAYRSAGHGHHLQSVVSVITSETTTLVPDHYDAAGSDVIVRHTNWEEEGDGSSSMSPTSPEEPPTGGLAGYFTLTLETSGTSPSCKRPLITKSRPSVLKQEEQRSRSPVDHKGEEDQVKVVTGADTLSAVVCLEEGLADDDSWVEELDNTGAGEDEFATTTPTEDSDSGEEQTLTSSSTSPGLQSAYSSDREEELRGYHRSAIDFTLHTIVEESCEESEADHDDGNGKRRQRPASASELEKYFFYGLGGAAGSLQGSPPGGGNGGREMDSLSDTCSSIYSEGLESLGAEDTTGASIGGDDPGVDDGTVDPAELASSRLEKYFLTGFMGFSAADHHHHHRHDRDSDGSGSVGSDSEGRPSPEQRRKKLVRARGTGRQHSSSLDNLGELSGAEQVGGGDLQESEDSSSTETDMHHDESGPMSSGFEKPDGQFDTVKRKKKKRNVGGGRSSPATPITSVDDKKSESLKPIGESSLIEKTMLHASAEDMTLLGGAGSNSRSSSSDEEEGCKTPQPEFLFHLPCTASDLSASRTKQQSRDSGFIGSCDDLLKDQRLAGSSDSSSSSNSSNLTDSAISPVSPSTTAIDSISTTTSQTIINQVPAVNESEKEKSSPSGNKIELSNAESASVKQPVVGEGVPGDQNNGTRSHVVPSNPPATSLTRKDSFNNWSSDEETNLMMSKMRAFFKTMVAASQQQQKTPQASPSLRQRGPSPAGSNSGSKKPPQLVYFENELTRLMKTVPGIKDEQVREIVEYLSSEDTWSDSYDSSDYTSSDLEGAAYYMQQQQNKVAACQDPEGRSDLQQQISDSCQQIINKFDTSVEDEEDEEKGLNRDTALVYQRLVASLSKMSAGEGETQQIKPSTVNRSTSSDSTPHSSPPLIAKVMHHIGSRLVALMHEVSGGEGGIGSVTTSSPKTRYHHHHHHHRRLQAKLSAASTTTDDDSHTDTEQVDVGPPSGVALLQLPRSKSHDLLLEPPPRPNSGGVVASSSTELAEEREASDYERFSWRGSFESALMAADSRTKLSLLQDGSTNSSVSTAAKRRSAGDLLFSGKSCSREQLLLDRVRSCGSIGGSVEDKIWNARRRRSSVPDANTCHHHNAGSGTSQDGDDDDDTDDDDDDDTGGALRSTTLPRSLQTSCSAGTNSLPRLPTSSSSAAASPAPSLISTSSSGGGGIYKAHSVHHFLQSHVKSARYRPPGFNRPAAPKRAVSAPGLQPHPANTSGSRGSRNNDTGGRKSRNPSSTATPTLSHTSEDASITEDLQATLPSHSKSASPSPIVGAAGRKGPGSVSSGEWPPSSPEEDIDRLVAIHQQRSSLSSLGPRSDSLASVYSGAEGRYGTVAVKGEVEFGLEYNYKASCLEIHVKQCRDLAPVDTKRNRSDPYVKVYLLPDKSKSGKRKTKVKKHTLNPVFDETLKFQMTLHGLETRTLWLTVWHSDMFGRNDFLGEVMMALENKVFDDPSPHWYPLQERTEPFDDLLSYKGDLIIGLKFVPPDVTAAVQKKGKRSSRGSLHVLVKEAKNLTAIKANGTSDPFCKSYLLPDKGRSSKQKTPVLRRTCHPVWNYTFVYEDVSLQELSERSLELTVWDHDRLASNEFLGGLRFNLGTGKHYGKIVDWMDATGKELTLWQHMLERPNFWVEGCLTLRPSLDQRNSS